MGRGVDTDSDDSGPTIAQDANREASPQRASAWPREVNPAGPFEETAAEDRYEWRRQLGLGSMGEVNLCRDKRMGRDVAKKVLLPNHQNDATLRARFLRECRIQGQLEHPSIVPVYDLGVESSGSAFFTMKCLRGMTL